MSILRERGICLKNKGYLCIAFIHWYILFFADKGFYKHTLLESEIGTCARLIFLILFWQFVAFAIRRYKTSEAFRSLFSYAALYFVFSMILLLFIWPGNWVYDAMMILKRVKEFVLWPWHHYLTGVFYFAALSLYPAAVSIVILQLACISLVVGYCIYAFKALLNGSKLAWLGYLPFLIPPLLIHNYTPLRSVLFSYLILFFCVRLIHLKWQGRPVKFSSLLSLALVAALIAVWRGEGIYFIIAAPVLFVCTFWQISSKNQKIAFAALTCVFAALLNVPQGKLITEEEALKYELSLYVVPLNELVKHAQKEERDDLLIDINEVLDIDLLKPKMVPPLSVTANMTIEEVENYVVAPGEDTEGYKEFEIVASAYGFIWYKPYVRDAYLTVGSKKLQRAFITLVKEYPDVFIEERVNNFNKTIYPWINFNEFEKDSTILVFEGDQASQGLDVDLRGRLLKEMTLEKHFTSVAFEGIIFPIILLFCLILALLLKRQFIFAFIIASVLPILPIVFLSAPEPIFMYYLPLYINGFVLTFAGIVIWFQRGATRGK